MLLFSSSTESYETDPKHAVVLTELFGGREARPHLGGSREQGVTAWRSQPT